MANDVRVRLRMAIGATCPTSIEIFRISCRLPRSFVSLTFLRRRNRYKLSSNRRRRRENLEISLTLFSPFSFSSLRPLTQFSTWSLDTFSFFLFFTLCIYLYLYIYIYTYISLSCTCIYTCTVHAFVPFLMRDICIYIYSYYSYIYVHTRSLR